jgi:hypothetical protein
VSDIVGVQLGADVGLAKASTMMVGVASGAGGEQAAAVSSTTQSIDDMVWKW